MRFRGILLYMVLFFCLSTGKVIAKTTDTGIWTELSVVKKIKKFSFTVNPEYYTKNNSTSLDRISIGFRGDYNILPHVKAGVGYMILNFKLPGYTELRNRFYAQIEPSWMLSGFKFDLRERVHLTLYPESSTFTSTTYYWRNKLRISKMEKSWKIEPLLEVETFCLLHPSVDRPFDEFRYSAGGIYHFNERQKLRVYGLLVDTPAKSKYIFGLSWEIIL